MLLKGFENTRFSATTEQLEKAGIKYTNQDVAFLSQKPTDLFFVNEFGFVKRHMDGNSERNDLPMVDFKEIEKALPFGLKEAVDQLDEMNKNTTPSMRR